MSRSRNNGLSKRCPCAPRKWNTCTHPWHFDFFKGKKFRFSLDKIATTRNEKPPRTKGAAEALADTIRGEIRSGTFVDPNHPTPVVHDPTAPLTVNDLLDSYTDRHVKVPGRRPSGLRTMLWHLDTLRTTEIPAAHGQTIRFGEKPLKDVTKADIENLRAARRAQATAAGRTSEVGTNRLLSRCRHTFVWAVLEGYLEQTPFKRGGIAAVKLSKETARSRRLSEGEEERLIASAGVHLKAVIIAAVSTGCRLGEVLGLQWQDVRATITAPGQTRYTLLIRAEKAKTNMYREIPVGSRLAAILEMRRLAPDGEPLGPEAYVFGNAVGEQVMSVKKAWQTCVLKAHGHPVLWVQGKKNHLSPESQAIYRSINLHLHDLRREFGSRILESGSSLVEARDLLGHANISQTSTYLASSAKSLGLAIEKMDQHEQQLAEARKRAAEAQQAEVLPGGKTSPQADALPAGRAVPPPLLSPESVTVQ